MKLYPGPVPLHYQLRQHLRDRIRDGEFMPGQSLPTEDHLCESYGVSRITVRHALDALCADGLITRRRGVGTFVADQTDVKSVRLIGLLDDTLSYTAKLTYKVLSRKLMGAPPLVATALELGPVDRVVCLQVIAELHGEPFAFADFYLPEAIGARVHEVDVIDNTPVIRIVEQKLGVRVFRAEQTVEPAVAGAPVAQHLGIKLRAPILRVVRTYYTEVNQPVECALVHYHPERYRYTVQLLAQAHDPVLPRWRNDGSERPAAH